MNAANSAGGPPPPTALSLAKRSVIAKVNGQLYDMKRPLDGDVSLDDIADVPDNDDD